MENELIIIDGYKSMMQELHEYEIIICVNKLVEQLKVNLEDIKCSKLIDTGDRFISIINFKDSNGDTQQIAVNTLYLTNQFYQPRYSLYKIKPKMICGLFSYN